MKMKCIKRLLTLAMSAVLLSVIAIPVNAAAGYEGEEWYDQIETVEVNREYAHSNFIPYQDADTALANEQSVFTKDLSESAYYQTLNGEWDFYFAENPAERLSDPDDESIDWSQGLNDKITVPSSIETQVDENGQFKYAKPIYTNQSYPWGNFENVTYDSNMGTAAKAPTVVNGIGHYQRTFTLPENWDGRAVFVSFQGVESAFYLYVNGEKVGYGEDSYTADDFNITPYLQEGENTISVQVYRWSTGSYLENQDFIRLSGIFREVYLYSKADVEIRDFFLQPELNDDFTEGTLTAEVDVRNLSGAAKNGTVEVQMYETATNTAVGEKITLDYSVDTAKTGDALIDDRGVAVSGSIKIENPELWTDETPNLYSVVIQLKDADGNVIETACHRVGFRKLENVIINDAGQYQLQVNGEKIMIRGTNRHESHLTKGRAIDFEIIKQDLLMMKQNNINALRMSHYPNNVWTYDLADEIGIYICDEANIESHRGESSGAGVPSKYPIWNNAVMARTQNMVERDKNHASVIIWSLGNEATYATYTMNENYCFYNSTQWILERDPSRIRKYERDNRASINADGTINREQSMVDIYSSQYWGVSSIVGHVTNTNNKIPYIQSEYSHAMGNAIGNLKEYWDVFRAYPNAQGGFIWDWVDQTVLTTDQVETFEGIVDKQSKVKVNVENVEFVTTTEGDKALRGFITLPETTHVDAAEMTLDAYVTLPADASLGNQPVIIGNGENGYNLKINSSGKLEAFFSGWSAGCVTADIPDGFRDGNWHRVTCTINAGGFMTLYVDGTQVGTLQRGSALNDYDTSNVGIGIGNDSEYTNRTWPGDIDAIRIMDKCMSADEVASGMAAADAENVVIGLDFADSEFQTVTVGEYTDNYWWGYGGDWDDKLVNDDNFVGNGIIPGDRSASPKLAEVKKVYQEVNFYDDGELTDGKVRVVNEYTATNLNEFDITWSLLKNDTVLATDTVTLDLAHGSESVLEMTWPELTNVREGDDYFVNFKVVLKEAANWAEAGHVIAEEQLVLDVEATEAQPSIDSSSMTAFTSVDDGENTVTITGKDGENDFEIVVDKTTGYISSYVYADTVLMTEGPVPNYYRAQIDNDMYEGDDANLKNTKAHFNVSSVAVDEAEKMVQITVVGSISTATASPNTITYNIFSNGEVIVNNNVTLNVANGTSIKRVGMKISVPTEFENFTYYGRGPWENYSDRNTGSYVGVYETTVQEIDDAHKYLEPQENGNHTDTRFAAVRNADGVGFMVAADDVMETSLSQYEDEDLGDYRHLYQVPKAEGYLVFNVDEAQRGLGGAACGPAPLSQYLLNNNETYSQTFRIVPFTSATNAELMEESKVNADSLNPIKDITVNGVSVGFDAVTADYNVKLVKGTFTGVPQVAVVKMSDDVTVSFEQPTALPAEVTITATSAFGVEKVYTVRIEEVDELYVSDMVWAVDEGGYFPNQRDVSNTDGTDPIRIYVDGVATTFEKGLGTHANSRIDVNIEGMNLTTFAAIAGINTVQGPTAPSDVIFKVIVDGKVAFEQRCLAGESYPVKVDVTNASVVSFVVDTNGADSNDHSTWADAKFTCEVPVQEKDEIIRISGKDRYATGYKAADALKETLSVDKFDAVVVATGKNFADALSGSYLAIVKEAPILLTNGKDDNVAELHAYIKENVNANGTVYILGGSAAVPETVEAIEGYTVKRLAGASRYDTNLEILAEAGITGTELIVATGKEFADSLSASAAGRPILLVKPGAALSAEQKAIVETVKDGNIYVVGGTGAVADTTAAELESYATVERIAGSGRQETSKKIAEKFFADAKAVVAANAKNFPDGLCGGPLAAAMNAPLLLTATGNTAIAEGYVQGNGLTSGVVLGGTGALSDESVVDIFGLESAEDIILK